MIMGSPKQIYLKSLPIIVIPLGKGTLKVVNYTSQSFTLNL